MAPCKQADTLNSFTCSLAQADKHHHIRRCSGRRREEPLMPSEFIYLDWIFIEHLASGVELQGPSIRLVCRNRVQNRNHWFQSCLSWNWNSTCVLARGGGGRGQDRRAFEFSQRGSDWMPDALFHFGTAGLKSQNAL